MMRLIGTVALVALAGATPVRADTRSEALLRDFVAWVDASPDWSATASLVRSDGSDTVAEGLVFSRDDPHVSISIEELRLGNLAERQGGGFSASKMEMRSGEIVTDTFDARIPAATASAVSLPSLDGVAIDPKHMMRSFARFYGIAAAGTLDELRIPEITAVQRQPASDGQEVEVRISYRDLVMTELSGGVLRHEEIGPISVASQSSPGAFEFAVDKLEADHIDLGAIAHIFDETQYRDRRGDEVWRPLMSRALYRGLSGSSGTDGASVRIAEMAVENIDGRQPRRPFTAAWDQFMDPNVPSDTKSDLALEAMSGMLGAFRVGTVRLDGMSVSVPKERTSFSLDGVTLSGWSGDGLDSFILKNLHAESPQVYASLDSMELAGFVSPDIQRADALRGDREDRRSGDACARDRRDLRRAAALQPLLDRWTRRRPEQRRRRLARPAEHRPARLEQDLRRGDRH